MKMISSTSTTSTSGVMLMSDCSLEPEPLSCMISVSLRLCAGALGDQSHSVEAGLLDREHDLPDLAEVDPCVTPDHDSGVRLVALVARLLRIRQVDIRSFAHLRRHHHEDDQQHEHHVDQRRDVDGRLHL